MKSGFTPMPSSRASTPPTIHVSLLLYVCYVINSRNGCCLLLCVCIYICYEFKKGVLPVLNLHACLCVPVCSSLSRCPDISRRALRGRPTTATKLTHFTHIPSSIIFLPIPLTRIGACRAVRCPHGVHAQIADLQSPNRGHQRTTPMLCGSYDRVGSRDARVDDTLRCLCDTARFEELLQGQACQVLLQGLPRGGLAPAQKARQEDGGSCGRQLSIVAE